MKAFSKIYRLNIACVLIIMAIIVFSCTDNSLNYVPAGGDAGEGEVTVQFTINAPGNINTRQTRNASGMENVINEVTVLVFENTIYKYSAEGTIIQQGAQTVFTAGLTVTNSPVRLYIVANAGAFPVNSLESGGIESDIRSALVRECEAGDFQTALPMFGTHELPSGLPQKGLYTINSVKLLRAVAAMDVTKDETIDNFELVSLQAFRSSNKIQLIPSDWNNDETPYVTRPYVPRNTTKTLRTKQSVAVQGTDSVTIYLPEATAPADGESFIKTTCLVAGGLFGGGPDITYYRIEIPNTQNSGNILRNYRYKFKVISVAGPGEATPEEAANGSSTKITAVVTNWEENLVDMIFEGEKYFGVTERSIKLPFRKKTAGIDVTTNLDNLSIQWCDENGNPLDGAAEAQEISNTLFNVKIVTDADGTSIQAASLQDNMTDNTRTAYFLIVATPWKIRMRIDQSGNAIYKDKYINILSFGLGIGGFGSNFPGHTSGGDAAAVRNMLGKTEHFGPNGTVPVGYVMFDYLTASTTDEDILLAYLEKYDVINISYSTSDIPELQAKAIVKWLEASPHRVLIYTRDSEARNKTMWETLYPGYTDVWEYGGSAGDSYLAGFLPANEYFTTTGPFGPIVNQTPSNTTVRVVDGIWMGIHPDRYPGTLIPLLKWNADDRLVLSIDPDRRIVYCADSSMWQARSTGWLSSGAVDSDKQRLLANFWAWIIEEVVMPGKVK